MLAVIPTMKIGMMGAWNQTCGVSIHAELVGRAWVEQGHPLRGFSFIENDYHGRSLVGQDEDYVTRCFGTSKLTNLLDLGSLQVHDAVNGQFLWIGLPEIESDWINLLIKKTEEIEGRGRLEWVW
jgi:hypothetical protein